MATSFNRILPCWKPRGVYYLIIYMNTITTALDTFTPISLSEMDEVKLLDRMDLKFVFHIHQLPVVLSSAAEYYKALTIDNKRFARYETHYFDTDDYELYTLHHNGRENRHKVRMRSYVDSDLHFFEIKFKSNKGRTIKQRVRLCEPDLKIEGEARQLLEEVTDIPPDSLKEAIRIDYNRITLVNNELTERLTIDFDMKYYIDGKVYGLPELVIAEVKQDKNGKSPFYHIMQTLRIQETSLSKYSFGIASYVGSVKKNNFKTKMLYVKKLCNS